MKRNKLVVLSVDALLWEDLYIARNYPGFSRIMKQHCGVEQVLSVYQTQTYPIHVVQATGQNMMDTGVYNNEAFQPGRLEPDWCWDVSYIKVPTIFDAAKKAGLTTCAIMWPVLARADIDFNIPEVWDLQKWEDPHIIFEPNCSAKGYEYFKKHVSKLEWHPKPGLDEFAVCLGEDILRNEMPDISFIHVSAVDIARHLHGMECPEVVEAIQKVDSWICRLLQAIDDAGYGEKTNFVICSDHGHLKVDRQVNLNVILREKGFITLDPVSEKVLDYKAYCHSSGLSSQVMLKDPDDEKTRCEVLALLQDLQKDPQYGIRRIYTREEVEHEFQLSGPFSYVIDGDGGIAFGHACTGRAIRLPDDPDYTYVKTSHGHRPEIGPQPTFLAAGPDFSSNVMLEHCSILDELPTYLQILGLEMDNLKGNSLRELVRTQEENA